MYYMVIFDGEYKWEGKKIQQKRPISWWSSSYWLKIIDVSDRSPDVFFIKPYICILSNRGKEASVKNCIQNLAKSVCLDFNLSINKVTWIEYFSGYPESMDVAMFKSITTIASETLYSVTWRSIMPNELEFIRPFSPEADRIAKNQNSL